MTFVFKYRGLTAIRYRSPPTTSGLETEWDYSGTRRGRDGQKKKIGKANEKSLVGKVKKSKR